MSIRVTIMMLLLCGLAIYAWRDWFVALCGLIVMMAVVEHPDTPKTMFGVQGLSPWNILWLVVVLAWMAQRRREKLTWDLPHNLGVLLMLYLGVVLIGFGRMILDRGEIEESITYLISEHLVNVIKFVVPGLLLFDGCRTRRRFHQALIAILGLYVLLALQVIRWMPLSSAMSGELMTSRSRKVLLEGIGFHAVNLSMLLAGASWAVWAAIPIVRRKRFKLLIVAIAVMVVIAQALTGGRMGYVTWAAVGLIMATLRWRKLLLIMPVGVALISLFLPGVVDRMMQGFGQEGITREAYTDDYQVTSGRTLIWPHVVEEIGRSPMFGHGREAMVRTGLKEFLWFEYGERFPHPHNAYLEWILDNGIFGLILVIPFYLIVLYRGVALFRDSSNLTYVVAGGVSTALLLALLVAGAGSQTFYPREGAVGMWAAIGLMLRVSVERARVRSAGTTRQPVGPHLRSGAQPVT